MSVAKICRDLPELPFRHGALQTLPMESLWKRPSVADGENGATLPFKVAFHDASTRQSWSERVYAD